jgi:hypothetical protein
MGMYVVVEDGLEEAKKRRAICDVLLPVVLALFEVHQDPRIHESRRRARNNALYALRTNQLSRAKFHLRSCAIPMDDIDHILTLLE